MLPWQHDDNIFSFCFVFTSSYNVFYMMLLHFIHNCFNLFFLSLFLLCSQSLSISHPIYMTSEAYNYRYWCCVLSCLIRGVSRSRNSKLTSKHVIHKGSRDMHVSSIDFQFQISGEKRVVSIINVCKHNTYLSHSLGHLIIITYKSTHVS